MTGWKDVFVPLDTEPTAGRRADAVRKFFQTATRKEFWVGAIVAMIPKEPKPSRVYYRVVSHVDDDKDAVNIQQVENIQAAMSGAPASGPVFLARRDKALTLRVIDGDGKEFLFEKVPLTVR